MNCEALPLSLESGFGFLISGGEATEVLEFAEATLDVVALLVEGFVVLSLHLAVMLGRNDRFGSRCFANLKSWLLGI